MFFELLIFCRWQYNRKWVSVFLVGISFSWYDWQGSWIVYFLSIIVYVFSGKPTEFAYNSKNIWYNPQKIYSKRHKISEGTFTVGFVSTKPLKWRKQFFVMETILKSVAFHLLPFQLVIPNFLSYSVKRWQGRKRKDPGDEFLVRNSRNKASMAKHKCLLWQLLKLHHTSFSTSLIKRLHIGSLNSITYLLKRPSATIHCS